MQDFYEIVVLALAIGTVSLTLTKSEIFSWIRDWLEAREEHAFWAWMSGLFSCPYCMSHWVSLGIMFLYQPLLINTGNKWPDLAVSWFALVALSSMVSGLILRIFK